MSNINPTYIKAQKITVSDLRAVNVQNLLEYRKSAAREYLKNSTEELEQLMEYIDNKIKEYLHL